MFRAKKVYELCFRAREGLPLPARKLSSLLIEAALARTQRDEKVVLCNYLWMPNHPHISLISNDIVKLKDFYGELKKRLTDMLKRLLDINHLTLWEDDTSVIEVLDIEMAIERHIYFFLNPAKANLSVSIEQFPGNSTWDAFCKVAPSTDAYVEKEIPWIRLPSIPKLSHENPSIAEERAVIDAINTSNRKKEILRIYPLAWIGAFGITEPTEIEKIRNTIIKRVKEAEQDLQVERSRARKVVVSREKLEREGFRVKGYVPTRKDRKIFFLSSLEKLRRDFYSAYRTFVQECRDCYRLALSGGRDIPWPAGAFRPPIPPLLNPL